jgi:hypothetical protein
MACITSGSFSVMPHFETNTFFETPKLIGLCVLRGIAGLSYWVGEV